MNKRINNEVFNKFPLLESNRLIFREFLSSDAEDLYAIRSNDKVMEFMDTSKHKSIYDTENLIKQVHNSYKSKTGINWIISLKSTSAVIGYFGYWRLMSEHCRGEIGFALKPEYWGKGFMFESLNKMIDFGFNDFKLHSIEANVNPHNKSSRKLLVQLGFNQEAYFKENYYFNGNFIDSIIYSLIEP